MFSAKLVSLRNSQVKTSIIIRASVSVSQTRSLFATIWFWHSFKNPIFLLFLFSSFFDIWKKYAQYNCIMHFKRNQVVASDIFILCVFLLKLFHKIHYCIYCIFLLKSTFSKGSLSYFLACLLWANSSKKKKFHFLRAVCRTMI